MEKTRKIVVNACHGGFGLSIEAAELIGFKLEPHDYKYGYYDPGYKFPRDDAKLVAAVEKLGTKAASGDYAKLQIVEIPFDVEWTVTEYDGYEQVEEVHRIWKA